MQEVVHMAMVTVDKKVILVVRRDGSVGFPGGKVDDTDKSLLDAVRRETREELGFVINNNVNIKHVMKRPIKGDMMSHFMLLDNLSLDAAHKIIKNFHVHEEIRAIRLVDTKRKNAKANLKLKNLANGVDYQLDVLFDHLL